MHGGCQLGMPRRVDDRPGTGCRHDCGHRAFVESARQLIATDQEVRRAELEEAHWSDDDEGAERARSRPALTLKAIMLDQRNPNR
jgi:hypothetical protein